MNKHVALGRYSTAVGNLEKAQGDVLTAIKEVRSAIGELPGNPIDLPSLNGLNELAAAANLNLSARYPDVVAAVKAAKGN
jgi:hypothetical protein